MRKATAAVGTGAFFVAAPGVVAGLIPWWLTGWRLREWPLLTMALRTLGVVLIVVGLVVLVEAFVRFVREGAGTPAPVAPTEQLVVGGWYRYVRNPMYLAVLSIIVGQALLLGQPGLLLYAMVVFALFAIFVRWFEEPVLAQQYGPSYAAYRQAVPAWWPRLRPWYPGMQSRK